MKLYQFSMCLVCTTLFLFSCATLKPTDPVNNRWNSIGVYTRHDLEGLNNLEMIRTGDVRSEQPPMETALSLQWNLNTLILMDRKHFSLRDAEFIRNQWFTDFNKQDLSKEELNFFGSFFERFTGRHERVQGYGIVYYDRYGTVKDAIAKYKRWFKEGITIPEIRKFLYLRLSTLKEAKTEQLWGRIWNNDKGYRDDYKYPVARVLERHGFTVEEARVWVDYLVAKNIYDYKLEKLLNENMGLKEIRGFIEAGVQVDYLLSVKKQFQTPQTFKRTCPQVIESNFVNDSPYVHLKKCVATCIMGRQVLSRNKIFGYAEGRAVIIDAKNALAKDFSKDRSICGYFKIKKATEIDLVSGPTVGNTLQRLTY